MRVDDIKDHGTFVSAKIYNHSKPVRFLAISLYGLVVAAVVVLISPLSYLECLRFTFKYFRQKSPPPRKWLWTMIPFIAGVAVPMGSYRAWRELVLDR